MAFRKKSSDSMELEASLLLFSNAQVTLRPRGPPPVGVDDSPCEEDGNDEEEVATAKEWDRSHRRTEAMPASSEARKVLLALLLPAPPLLLPLLLVRLELLLFSVVLLVRGLRSPDDEEGVVVTLAA
jgi:hypothetical protein